MGLEDKSLTAHTWYPENKMADFLRRQVVSFLIMLLDEEDRKTVNRTQWQCKRLQRQVMGTYHSIFMELAVEDMAKFFEFIRKSYLELLNLISLSITRENTHLRSTIPP